MEICLQAALRLKSCIPKIIYSSVCYTISSHKRCYLSLQTWAYLANTLISFHYPSTLHIFLSTDTSM